MTLIKSISGIRGTIGGFAGNNLTPLDIVKFVSAYGKWIKNQTHKSEYHVVVGRDARISGELMQNLVNSTLISLGINVFDIGLSTTPATEMAVTDFDADGGIILTASHNPVQWNALKLLNKDGEFLTAEDGALILKIAENIENEIEYADVYKLGTIQVIDNYVDNHIQHILNLDLVDVEAIQNANFRIAIDCVNSVGGIAIPKLLKAIGVKDIIELYCTPDGNFPHNPEPLPDNLRELSKAVVENKAHLGFAVDPDVDRLAIVNEDGSMFGEEYTLVAVADYILQNNQGNTVSNLSSSRALRDVTMQYGGNYTAAAVGELNVVKKMKETESVIGGEGNGGVIYPELHYGRDALVGIALFLSYLAKMEISCSTLKASYPVYTISKNKIELTPDIEVDKLLQAVELKFRTEGAEINTIDGIKIDFEHGWVHLRKSNTEPIIRIYAESYNEQEANKLADSIISEIKKMAQK